MRKKIAEIYGYDNVAGISQFIGVAVGAAIGAKLAVGISDLIPGVGSLAK